MIMKQADELMLQGKDFTAKVAPIPYETYQLGRAIKFYFVTMMN